MYVIGTAGHVDHGKSSLVEALTGIDPDRLLEEKERGLTIDLGFAWFLLPSGKEVSIVDVPGHERFIKNMLAGVGAIDLAILVVAADESVMPQTLEHLSIIDLLQIRSTLVVITKCDLVDGDLVGLVKLEIEESIKGTSLEGSSIISVSSVSREGFPELVKSLDNALDIPDEHIDLNRPRLLIDRSFSISGFGTVVTGTLIDGCLTVGQEVLLARSGTRSRIRGIQSHKHQLTRAIAGTRIAVNLINVKAESIKRGEVSTVPGWLRHTRAIDAKVRILRTAPHIVRHNFPITIHMHTAEALGKLRLLNFDFLRPGEEGWAQVWLEEPLPMVRGDRFVFRSTDQTLGGGVVVDLETKKHRRRNLGVINHLEALTQDNPLIQLSSVLHSTQPAEVASLAERLNMPLAEILAAVQQGVFSGSIFPLDNVITDSTYLFTYGGWVSILDNAQKILSGFHSQFPLRLGMSREELRSRLNLHGKSAPSVILALLKSEVVVEDGAVVRLNSHTPMVSTDQQDEISDFLNKISHDPFPMELPGLSSDLLALLVERGQIVRMNNNIVMESDFYKKSQNTIIQHLRANGEITLAEARDLLATSRKYAQAILEHMDYEKITRRIGDSRLLL